MVSSSMGSLAVFTTLSSAVSALYLPQTVKHAKRAEIADWSGWASIQSMFVFGDSYTTTGFNASTGPQPNATNPLGNPPYPGYTSSNGPNWIDFLTTTYNASLIETYNLAYGSATVDSALVEAVPRGRWSGQYGELLCRVRERDADDELL